MPSYRMYSLDADGRIGFPEEIAATDNQEAISQVRKIKPHAKQCEIWEGKRLITSLGLQDVNPA